MPGRAASPALAATKSYASRTSSCDIAWGVLAGARDCRPASPRYCIFAKDDPTICVPELDPRSQRAGETNRSHQASRGTAQVERVVPARRPPVQVRVPLGPRSGRRPPPREASASFLALQEEAKPVLDKVARDSQGVRRLSRRDRATGASRAGTAESACREDDEL